MQIVVDRTFKGYGREQKMCIRDIQATLFIIYVLYYMFYVCNSNNPPALGWNTHPDSIEMVHAVKMY